MLCLRRGVLAFRSPGGCAFFRPEIARFAPLGLWLLRPGVRAGFPPWGLCVLHRRVGGFCTPRFVCLAPWELCALSLIAVR